MKEQIEGLKALIDNPDDLSTLPQIITQLEEYHTNSVTREDQDLERITKLQDANRNLLSQIPISNGEPDKEKEKTVTFEHAQEQLINAMQNVGGNQ